MKGVEPSSAGWKPAVMSITLPLYDTRDILHPGGMGLYSFPSFVVDIGFEPMISSV